MSQDIVYFFENLKMCNFKFLNFNDSVLFVFVNMRPFWIFSELDFTEWLIFVWAFL